LKNAIFPEYAMKPITVLLTILLLPTMVLAEVKKQNQPNILFVLVAGMMVTTAKNVFATKDGTGKPAMEIFA